MKKELQGLNNEEPPSPRGKQVDAQSIYGMVHLRGYISPQRRSLSNLFLMGAK